MGDLNETSFLALNASVDASPLTVALAIGAAKYLVLVIEDLGSPLLVLPQPEGSVYPPNREPNSVRVGATEHM